MYYKVIYSKEAFKQLKKMDNHNKLYILSWIDKNLEDCNDPYERGKSLKEQFEGSIRYRVGDYRIITDIQVDKSLILVVNIEHRSKVYR
ncbi:type II toxin-antitoxin system RelE family toxin [Tissierella creatinophila]|uniref:Toxin RelG n=1 Tax=Tissierella creatinophila DSM 6911 TaxID=1123403 RepID=A0A1U7M4Z9_TISCR|nr:type II toxin-antitoxin system RelE/ParE family toxin [Tissierella creatinophila]OLS02392.1 toxin RelG [Tissierella creatinophila DSM 6911]